MGTPEDGTDEDSIVSGSCILERSMLILLSLETCVVPEIIIRGQGRL